MLKLCTTTTVDEFGSTTRGTAVFACNLLSKLQSFRLVECLPLVIFLKKEKSNSTNGVLGTTAASPTNNSDSLPYVSVLLSRL
jgi:hypothetical protein